MITFHTIIASVDRTGTGNSAPPGEGYYQGHNVVGHVALREFGGCVVLEALSNGEYGIQVGAVAFEGRGVTYVIHWLHTHEPSTMNNFKLIGGNQQQHTTEKVRLRRGKF
jgi:hypothetical protein